ncbi:hypothetical protein Emag_003906 [Eimeria magna]
MPQASGQQHEKPAHEERMHYKQTGTQQQEQQQHDERGEVAEGAVAATGSKGDGGLQGPLRRMLHELQLQQHDVSLLVESVKYLDSQGWLPQKQPLPAAAAAGYRAAVPSTLPLFVQRQRLGVYRQQLQAFRQILPLLVLLLQIADSLSSNLTAATSRLSTERQNLLPLLQELLHLRQRRQHVEDIELVCQTILKRFLLSKSTIKSMTRTLPPASATEATVTELRETRHALNLVQDKRRQLQAAAAAADVSYLLLEDLTLQMQELQDVGYERLFLLVLQRLQQLAAAATATQGSARDAKDPIGTSIQALHEVTKRLQKGAERHQHMTPPAAFPAKQAEATEAEISEEDAALWEAMADLHRHPAYVLQSLQQLLRLRRQLLVQRFMASSWGPLDFANAAEVHSPFDLALEWMAVAAAEEAYFFMSLSRLFPSSESLDVLELQQQEHSKRRSVTTPGQIVDGASSDHDGLPASYDPALQSKGAAAEEDRVSSNPQRNPEQQSKQEQQDLAQEISPAHQHYHQQEHELRHEKREWLPPSEVPTFSWEGEVGGATVPQLLSPLPLIEAALEVLEGPLAAGLSKLLSSDTHSKNSKCGILALKAAFSLQRVAVKIEEILAAAAAQASPPRLKQEQDERLQRKPLLSKFLLELAEKAVLAFEDQWEATALHLPQLSAATATKWSPTAGAWEPSTSSLPSFLTNFAATLQNLLLALTSCLPPGQQQTKQQEEQQLQQEGQKQEHEEISTLHRLDALLSRDVLRAANYCLQAAHHMEDSHACVFTINALCCLRSALQPLLAPFSQARQQQQLLLQIVGLRELQQQHRLLSELIEEKTAELGTLEGNRLCDSFGVTLRLEAIEAYTGVERSKASQVPEQLRKKNPAVSSLMSPKAAEDLLTREKLEDFFAFFMGKVYGAFALDLPLVRCLSQAGPRREARKKALEALVEGFAAISVFAAENGQVVSPHTPEQVRLLLDL